MTQPAKAAQEPSMEEILASIRRIIADDESKPASAAAPPPAPQAAKPPPPRPAAPPPPPAPAPAPAKNSQDDIDAMLANFDAETAAPPAATETAPDDDDVFELTEQMAVPEPAPQRAAFTPVEPSDDLEFADPLPPAEPRAPATAPTPRAAEPDPRVPTGRPLMSASTMTAVESAFSSLANTVLSNNARTLEDLVKEMLRPMLKSWIDDNLPTMVERIVRAEIERVSRGR